MERYTRLMQNVSEWFQAAQGRHADEMRCGRGCARCCYGLFDISLPDALHVALSLGALSARARSSVTARASEIHREIIRQAPEFKPPYLLNPADEPFIDWLVSRVPEARCPFLDSADVCTIYEHRPLACRLEGMPMVDRRDGLFGDWCELNFTGGVPAQAQKSLAWDYYELQETERASTMRVSARLWGKPQEAVTVLIPAVILEHEGFWVPLLDEFASSDFAI